MKEHESKSPHGHLHAFPSQLGARAMSMLLQAMFYFLLARHLHPGEFGDVAFATVIFALLLIIADFGSEAHLIQTQGPSASMEAGVLVFTIGVVVIGIALVMTATHVLDVGFLQASTRGLVLMVLPCSVLAVLQIVPRARLFIQQRYVHHAYLEAGSLLFAMTSGSLGLALGMKQEAFAVYLYVLHSVRLIWLWWMVGRPSLSIAARPDFSFVRDCWKFLQLHVSNHLTRYVDDLLIGFRMGTGSLGLYNFSYRLVRIQQDVLAQALRKTAFSSYSSVRKDVEIIFDSFLRDTKFLVSLSIPALVFVAVSADVLIPIVFGEQWKPAVFLVQMFSIEAMRQSLMSLSGVAIIAGGGLSKFLSYSLRSALVLLLCFLVLSSFSLPIFVIGYFAVNTVLDAYLFRTTASFFSQPGRLIVLQWLPGVSLGLATLFGIGLTRMFGSDSIAISCLGILLTALLVFSVVLMLPELRVIYSIAFSRRKATGSIGEQQYIIVFTDALDGTKNPHLKELHKAIQERYPTISMKSLNRKELVHALIMGQKREILGSQNQGIVHVHFPNSLLISDSRSETFRRVLNLVLSTMVFRICGFRLFYTAHNLQSHSSRYPVLDRWVHRFVAVTSDTVLTLSHRGITELRNAHGRTESVYYTPHPTYVGMYPTSDNATVFNGLEDREGEFRFLFFGEYKEYKGLERLLNAFQRVRPGQPTTLIIAGEGYSSEAIARTSLDQSMRIVTIGHRVDDSTLVHLFSQVDFGILPYNHILHSGTAMLFWTFHCPVIAPDTGFFPEMIGRYEVGLTYEHLSERSLSEAIERAREDGKQAYLEGMNLLHEECSLDNAVAATARAYWM